MSDPIKDLEEFPTVPTTPLPAHEVRRRGDRLRRRRRALSGIGSVAAIVLLATGGYVATQLGNDDHTNGDRQVAARPATDKDIAYGPLTEANVMADADTVLPSGDAWQRGAVHEGDGQAGINQCQRVSFEGLGADQVFVGIWSVEALHLSQAVAQFPDTAAAAAAADEVRQWLADCTPPVSTAYSSEVPVPVDAGDAVDAERVTSRWTYTGEEGGEAYADHEMKTVILVSGNRMSMITVEAPTGTEGITAAADAMATNAGVRLVTEKHSPGS